jgi:hypothetical protein
MCHILPGLPGMLLAASFLLAAPGFAQTNDQARVEAYLRAQRAYEEEASAYWRAVGEKRGTRNEKRRNNQPVVLADYVPTQPPVYSGPSRPPSPAVPPAHPRPQMHDDDEILIHAAEVCSFENRSPHN